MTFPPSRSSRRRVWVLPALLALLPALATAQSPDVVRLTDKSSVIGEIVSVSPSDVEIKDQRNDETVKVPIDRIGVVMFAGEPAALRDARSMLLRQDPAGALEELTKIEQVELDGASENVLAEVAFVKAAATARQATVTGAELDAGEKALRAFLQKHSRSVNVFRANEALGDLLVRAGKFDDAAAAYAALEKGPPALRVRAATSKGNSLYEQKKYVDAEREYAAAEKTCVEAEQNAETERKKAEENRVAKERAKAFDEVVEWKRKEASAIQDRGTAIRQRHEAQTGRARCLVRQGKAPDAVKLLQGVVRETDPDDRELLCRAYAVLGDAYKAAKQDQDAIIAFLTVDLVYNSLPESHAEALYNLVQLWQKVQNPERSREARQALETAYPDSRWTKAVAAVGGKD